MPRTTKTEVAAAILDTVLDPSFINHPESLKGEMEPIEPLPESVASEEVEAAVGFSRRIEDNIRRAVKVRDDVLRHVVVALLAEGHILVEDYPGVGKTALARALSRTAGLPVRARAVHRRPAPGRHRRRQHLQPARAALRVPPRPDLRQHRARGRDQPRLAQDPVRPARVHAGAPRHRRRALARAGEPVHGVRDAEPGRVRGHLPAARGAGRSLHGPALARLPVARRRGRHARRSRVRRPRARPRAGRRPHRRAHRAGRRPARARLARAARLRGRAAAPHARRHARRARRLAARRA